jgi:hypothetical protein
VVRYTSQCERGHHGYTNRDEKSGRNEKDVFGGKPVWQTFSRRTSGWLFLI